jgi:ABC-type multidrug transport system fused ATPase/permease subunit
MSVVHTLVITVNLLVAVLIYVAASSGSRLDPILTALGGGFFAIAIVDLMMAIDGGVELDRIAIVIFLDVMLLAVAAVVVAREHRRRRRLEVERLEAEGERRRRLEDDLQHDRDDRDLALRDRSRR